MTSSSEQWMEQAQYDLETARSMLASKRLLYVLFCCQQAVEKALKSVIVRKTGEFPPRVHNLMRLAELAAANLPTEQVDFLRELSFYYIQSRYPDEIENIGQRISHDLARDVLEKTERTIEWLHSIP